MSDSSKIMESDGQDKKLPRKKVVVRTVTDVEVGSTASPTSPPASVQERAKFQRLLLNLNGLSVSQSDGASSKDTTLTGEISRNESNKALKEQARRGAVPSNEQDKQPSQKRKKKRGAGKKSNKPTPDDSPQKIVVARKEGSVNPLPMKQEHKQTVAENITQAVKASSSAQANLSTESKDKPPKLIKSSQSSKVASALENNFEQNDLTTSVIQENQSGSHLKPKLMSRQPAKVSKVSKGDKLGDDTHRDSEESEVRDSNGKFLLKLAINLMQPKSSSKVKEQVWECSACDKLFSDVAKHLEKSKAAHKLGWKCEMRRRTIDLLPGLSSKHITLLDELVSSTVEKCKTQSKHQQLAHSIWQSLDTLAKTKFKDCSVRWFGSHVNGIALSSNNVLNMDLLVQNKEEAATTFLNFISAVEAEFEDVDRVVSTKFAHANITYQGMVIQLSLNNNGAYNTAKLIGDYISIDKRVQPLCIFLRYWGKICGIDLGEDGSWQGHAFPIMVIHFLQQRKVLPVLHDMVENPEGIPELYYDPKEYQGRGFGVNTDTVGTLLFELFRYYAIEHDVEKHVVSITQCKPFLRRDTKWNAARIAIIDPFQPKHNISRYISANMYDYIHFCFLTTTCSLGIPRSSSGPLFGFISQSPEPSIFDKAPAVLEEYLSASNKIYELVLRLDNCYNAPALREDNEEKVPALKAELLNSWVYRELHNTLRVVPRVPDGSQPSTYFQLQTANWWVTPFQASGLVKHFNSDVQVLTFSKELCTEIEAPAIGCTLCHKSDHLRGNCPDEVIPKMNPVPPPSKELQAVLNQLCLEIFESRCSEDSGLRDRTEIRDDLLMWLRRFSPDVDLHLFGSSLNGFGGRSSDIDMCLTFQSNPTGEGLNFPLLVEKIQHALRDHRSVYQLIAITTAKVPIVKFEYGRNRIQVDISLYNRLGMMNTKLLQAYSVIDPRVRPLVYMMKTLAKATDIGDASRGSLSSYAYSLMSLYFLQQVEPPVIPVLQELYDPDVGPKVETVDGANVYFFKNQNKLDEVWPHRYSNKSSLGELWLQLLEFYALEKFHNSQRVVCIRKKDPLYKFDKLWTSTNICIEDPFDLNHNLGSGLSKRMNIFIVKTFQKACKHFSSLPRPDKSLEKYYFNEIALSAGKPPSDRGCHFCRSIGHRVNECPKRLMQQQRHARPNGRANWGHEARQNHAHDNYHRGGNRRETGRGNHGRGDPGRISNLPEPARQHPPQAANHQNHPRPMNVQNHVVVGNMRPPGFPPGYSVYGPPSRLVGPQMVQHIRPQVLQGAPLLLGRPPVRPWP